jgi:Tfp pilus assembly protein PilO
MPENNKLKYNYRGTLNSLQQFSQTKQAKSFTWLSLTLVTTAFFVLVAIEPTLVTIAKLVREIKVKREANKNLEEKIKSLVAAQAAYVKNSDNLFLLEEALPKKNEFPSLASFFEQKAEVSLVEIKTISFDKLTIGEDKDKNRSEQGKGPLSFSFSISVTGKYQNLKEFLRNLETSPRIIFLETTNFNPVKIKIENDVSTELSLSITGNVFFEQR